MDYRLSVHLERLRSLLRLPSSDCQLAAATGSHTSNNALSQIPRSSSSAEAVKEAGALVGAEIPGGGSGGCFFDAQWHWSQDVRGDALSPPSPTRLSRRQRTSTGRTLASRLLDTPGDGDPTSTARVSSVNTPGGGDPTSTPHSHQSSTMSALLRWKGTSRKGPRGGKRLVRPPPWADCYWGSSSALQQPVHATSGEAWATENLNLQDCTLAHAGGHTLSTVTLTMREALCRATRNRGSAAEYETLLPMAPPFRASAAVVRDNRATLQNDSQKLRVTLKGGASTFDPSEVCPQLHTCQSSPAPLASAHADNTRTRQVSPVAPRVNRLTRTDSLTRRLPSVHEKQDETAGSPGASSDFLRVCESRPASVAVWSQTGCQVHPLRLPRAASISRHALPPQRSRSSHR
jgi:hypothetical protein